MKIKFAITSITMMLTVIFFSMSSVAATFKTDVYVTADDNGIITISSGGKEIERLIQFCPDDWVDGCDDNIVINREGNTFELDKEALRHHQTAFNFLDASKRWLLIPNKLVRADQNLKIIETMDNKAYFLYTGAAAK